MLLLKLSILFLCFVIGFYIIQALSSSIMVVISNIRSDAIICRLDIVKNK
jgi:hypothetical protein